MLANMKDLLKEAEEKKNCIGCFNVLGLENILAVIRAAEELNIPAMIQFAQAHEEEGVAKLDVLAPIMMEMAKRAKVPIGVHLDHAVDLDYIKKGLDYGFASVMFDGSSLPYEKNVELTKKAVSMAREHGASVEAEVGVMAGLTLNDQKIVEDRSLADDMYTNPKIAKQFSEETGIDALACAFGTVHGLYKSKPKLNVDLVKELNQTLPVPIVMHGGSGLSDEDFKNVIAAGVRKTNYYTYMAKEGAEAVRKAIEANPPIFFHDMANIATDAMKENVKKTLRVFCNL